MQLTLSHADLETALINDLRAKGMSAFEPGKASVEFSFKRGTKELICVLDTEPKAVAPEAPVDPKPSAATQTATTSASGAQAQATAPAEAAADPAAPAEQEAPATTTTEAVGAGQVGDAAGGAVAGDDDNLFD